MTTSGRGSGVTVRPRVGISRCLLGDAVRYDGGHKRDDDLVEALRPHVEWVSVCPEVEVGMGVPREPIQLVTAVDGRRSATALVRLVGVTSGTDWTMRMERWARERIAALGDLSGFVLKARSPSCGPDGVAVIDAAGAASPSGRGLFAQILLEMRPDLPVAHEDALHTPEARVAFLGRVLTYTPR